MKKIVTYIISASILLVCLSASYYLLVQLPKIKATENQIQTNKAQIDAEKLRFEQDKYTTDHYAAVKKDCEGKSEKNSKELQSIFDKCATDLCMETLAKSDIAKSWNAVIGPEYIQKCIDQNL